MRNNIDYACPVQRQRVSWWDKFVAFFAHVMAALGFAAICAVAGFFAGYSTAKKPPTYAPSPCGSCKKGMNGVR